MPDFEEVVSWMVPLSLGINGLISTNMLLVGGFAVLLILGMNCPFSISSQDVGFARLKTIVFQSKLEMVGLNQKTEGETLRPSSSKLGTCQGCHSFYLQLPNSVSKPIVDNSFII